MSTYISTEMKLYGEMCKPLVENLHENRGSSVLTTGTQVNKFINSKKYYITQICLRKTAH
jgi:hypothetical protein